MAPGQHEETCTDLGNSVRVNPVIALFPSRDQSPKPRPFPVVMHLLPRYVAADGSIPGDAAVPSAGRGPRQPYRRQLRKLRHTLAQSRLPGGVSLCQAVAYSCFGALSVAFVGLYVVLVVWKPPSLGMTRTGSIALDVFDCQVCCAAKCASLVFAIPPTCPGMSRFAWTSCCCADGARVGQWRSVAGSGSWCG